MPSTTEPKPASAVQARPAPHCPECGEPMEYYGGSGGYICHEFKILVKAGGWFDDSGARLDDRRLHNPSSRGLRRH
jgi:hypothetical protein